MKKLKNIISLINRCIQFILKHFFNIIHLNKCGSLDVKLCPEIDLYQSI